MSDFVQRMKSYTPVAVGTVGTWLYAGAAHAEPMTSIIDFSVLKTDMLPALTTAVTAGAALGAVVLLARMGWRFFKSFGKG